jgi:hypothetical protein
LPNILLLYFTLFLYKAVRNTQNINSKSHLLEPNAAMKYKHSINIAITMASLTILRCSFAQDFTFVAGEGTIGDESLTAVADGADFVAKVPNSGGTWSADGSEGVVSSNLNSPTYTVPVDGAVTLNFTHRYNIEDDGPGGTRWDAGAVFISVNEGPSTYLDGSAFTQNTYDGFGLGGDGRTITGNCPPIGAAAPDGKFGFSNTSPGFASGALIESIANLGTFTTGDTIAVTFTGAWDEGFILTPAPNWEIGTFLLRDSANAAMANIDFQQGAADFTVTNVGGVAGPWIYAGAPPVVFDLNADTQTADRYVANPAGASSFIDLNGANLIVKVTGTLDVGDTFDLFEGGLMRGNYGSIALPDGQWDLSGLAPGGDGTIVYTSNALSGWLVRALDVVGGGGFESIDTLPEAETFLNNTGTANISIEGDRTEVRSVLDLGGGGGNYGVNLPYPLPLSGTLNEDFVIEGTTLVSIPAGTWSIAVGTDDGGLIKVAGVNFSTGAGGGESRFGEDASPVRTSNDSVRFEGIRGHSWTGGTFVLNAPLTTTITAIMFERGGGDSVEVAFRDASGGISNDPQSGSASGWSLLIDGVNSWTVRSGTTTDERGEAIHVGGKGSTRIASGSVSLRNAVYGPSTESPGLTQEWWQQNNPGNKAAIDSLFTNLLPNVGPFKGTDGGGTGTWWTGNGTAIAGIQNYPATTSALLRENYITRLTGEIFIPENGAIRFKDGVDDFTYLTIDLNGNGILGEADDGNGQSEILINDNTWTNVETSGNGGSPVVSRNFTVDAGGEWVAMEFNTGEGGGGDAGVLYWDYNGGIGGGTGFPAAQADGIDLATNGAALLVPDTNLRSTIAPIISAELVASLSEPLTYEFEIAPDGSHDTLTVTNPNTSLYTSIIDLSGAHLAVLFTGEEPAPGTVADFLDGAIEGNYASITLPPGNWDVTGLEPGGDGTVIFLSGIPFVITSISYDGANTATFTFNSKVGHLYAVDEYSSVAIGWNEITDSESSMGEQTTYIDTMANTPWRLYRVRDLGLEP